MDDTRGFALVVAMMTMMMLMALGLALVITTSSETITAYTFRSAQEASYACEAAIERAMVDVAAAGDWSALVDGSAPSGFTDGPPGGRRTLADGSSLDLPQIVGQANSAGAGSPNSPVWRLYAFNRLDAVAPAGTISSPYYLVVMVAADPGATGPDPPRTLWLRSEAFGPRGIHKVIEITVSRDAEEGVVRVLSWRSSAALTLPLRSRTIAFEPILV